jgi:hypothetical protein
MVTFTNSQIDGGGNPTTITAQKYTASDGTVFTNETDLVAYEEKLNKDAADAQAAADAKATADAKAAADAKVIADAKAAADKVAADKAAADAATKAAEEAKLKAKQDNAIASAKALFASYGLEGEFADSLIELVKKDYNSDTIALMAQDPSSKTPLALAFQARFAGNKARIAAGLPPLSPAEYIATEKSYRAIMGAAGLPKGFYDSKDDFTKFISMDISATELQNRVNVAAKSIANADPFYTQSLQSMYGLSTGDMIAHALDPNAALPLLQKQAAAVEFGAAAGRQGLGVSASTAEQYAGLGVTSAQAEQGFKTISQMLPEEQRLAARFTPTEAAGQGAQLETEIFGGAKSGQAELKRKRLQQQEENIFSGSSGAGKGSLYTESQGTT